MSIEIRTAVAGDTAAVTDCVCQAFIRYILRIGKQPGPMLDDYQALIQQGAVHVACRGAEIVGTLVLLSTDEGFCIETIAVAPRAQGQGIGGMLLSHSETVARRLGYTSIYLSTHRLMHESQFVYEHLGFIAFDERVVNGYDRIFYRKNLQPADHQGQSAA